MGGKAKTDFPGRKRYGIKSEYVYIVNGKSKSV
jgi:hypothetical protein